MKDKFYEGFWHNGRRWIKVKKGGALTLSSLKQTKHSATYRLRNEDTVLSLTTKFTKEHENILREWSEIISGFQHRGHIGQFIFYMSTHPFGKILEFRINGELIGFDWFIHIEDTVFHQLFPWKKKEFSRLGLGTFGKEKSLEIWPTEIHFFGRRTDFKNRFGGWGFNGAYQAQKKNNTIA
jgi:hypothetical protein